MTWLYGFTDPADRWLAEDKMQHLLGGMLCGSLLWITGDGLALALLGTFVAGVAVEVVEVIRYGQWVAKQSPQPWPFLCDKVSPKDLVVDVFGGLLGWCAAALLARLV